jgi:2-(1,2-epoxy-1,2-dihydrophenyl)acetyl-CoA isomerase
MADYETIEVAREGGAARLTLNRPDQLNAWSRQFGIELSAAIAELGADESVRAVLITGAGRAFSSGADLKEERSADDGEVDENGLPDLSKRLKDVYHPVITGIRDMPKPVVAAVNGPAVGIGCSLALACDLVLAGESAYFLLAFVNIGLVPDGGASAFVPARAGLARATEMMMLGEKIPAATAVEWGLANRVVPDADLPAEAASLLERLAAGPTASYAGAKELINRNVYANLADQLEAEADRQKHQGGTADFVEGVISFMQKRPPEFTGR